MTGEGLSYGMPAVEAAVDDELVVDYDRLLDDYGIGPDEADTIVTFGGHTGPLAAAVSDERCPVGNMLATAYKTGGVEEVNQKLGLFKLMDPGFDVQIGSRTRAFHEGTVDRTELLARPEPGGGETFLA